MQGRESCAPSFYAEWSEHGVREKLVARNDEWAANIIRAFVKGSCIQEWDGSRTIPEVIVLHPSEAVGVRFYRLAATWSADTAHVSSTKDLISHPSYQQIIALGWDVVPSLLMDLRDNKRFWFPALYSITGVRPFDRRDSGNVRRMTDAWLKWGKRKGIL